MKDVCFIDDIEIKNKKVLLRVDFNVALNTNNTIADDARIKQALPTIEYLLKNNNKLILISHLGRPNGRDSKYSLKVIVDRLKKYLKHKNIVLIDDFLSKDNCDILNNQKPNDVFILENIRFYTQEKKNDQEFAKRIADLADIYVNDAFGVSHRKHASLVSTPKYIPSYGGLLLKKEIDMISKIIKNPKKPFVSILGGVKISTKIQFIEKLMDLTDFLLLGGGLANLFLLSKGYEIGKSICERDEEKNIKKLINIAKTKKVEVVLPVDAIVANSLNAESGGEVKKVNEVNKNSYILDIGPETQAQFGSIISKTNTIVWNGPVGYIENIYYRRGTDFIYYSIANNKQAFSIVGGGDTLAAVSKKEHLEDITHISTGGGAMLEFIENGTLPGIEALKKDIFYFV